MSFGRILTGLWKTSEETRENSVNETMKTKFYRSRGSEMVETILQVIQHSLPAWKVTHVDRERGEIVVEKRQGARLSDITISVVEVGPMRSAVDMVCAVRGAFGDLGSCYFSIQQFFQKLHSKIKPM